MDGLGQTRVRNKIDKDNYMFVKIGRYMQRALIDTGAHYSCVSMSFMKRLHLLPKMIKGSNQKRLFTADGKPLMVAGTIQLTINIHGLMIPTTFQVIKSLNHDIILGMAFLTNTQANIDLAKGEITLYDGLVGANLVNPEENLLRTVDAVWVPARSEALIPVTVPFRHGSGLSIIEPSITLSGKYLALARSIVTPKGNRTVCKVLNPTNAGVFLKRRTVLASIQKISIDSVTVVDDKWSDIQDNNEKSVSLEGQLKSISQKGIKLEKNSLKDEEYRQLVGLIYQNVDLFATGMKDLVGTDIVRHEIDTGDARPIRKRTYRQSPQMMREMEKQVDEMLEAGILEPSDSPWSSPCLLIKKSGVNEYRFVNDLRGVNQLTKPIHWPMPTMEDIFDTVADRSPTIFSNIDLKHAYFQIKLTDDSKPKTAFTVGGKHYQYTRMVMGLSNSAQCWQRLLTRVLSDMLFKYAIVYLDDVLVLSRNFTEHMCHLRMLFQKFRQSNLRMNGKKCKFAVDQVKYLGHILSGSGVAVDSSKFDLISGWPTPKTSKQVKSFLGVASYYRRFIERFSQLSAPLRELIAKDKTFNWGKEQQDAFDELKSKLCNPPVLRFPDSRREYFLETDASIQGISYILGQRDDEGRKYVVSYGGRGLRPCERRWPVTQLECLALLSGIKEYHVYLAGRPFSVYTDHLSLKFLQSLKVSANNRLARWALALQPYTFEINYKEGKKLTAADGLSRRPYEEAEVDEDDDELAEDSFITEITPDLFETVISSKQKKRRQQNRDQITALDGELEEVENRSDIAAATTQVTGSIDLSQQHDVAKLQRECPDYKPIFDYIEEGILPQEEKTARKIVFESEQFIIDDGILYHLFHPRTKRMDEIVPIVKQLCIPRILREELMVAYHDNNCHVGQERLYNSLKMKYWFPLMYSAVLQYVASCALCQKTKTSQHQKRAPLKPLEVVEPFGRVHMDFVGPLPQTTEGYRHILIVVDSTTLYVEAFPTKSTTAEEVAEILYKEIIARYGVMREILTDQGSSFKNKLIAQLCKLLNIKHRFSSPHHPQTDGKAERMVQTVIRSLRLICDTQTQWAEKLTPVLMSYRSTVTMAIGTSPYHALYGREMVTGIDTNLLQDFSKSPNMQSYMTHLVPRLKLTHDIVQQNLRDGQIKSKQRYDENSEEPKMQVGEKVLMHDPTTKTGECPKLKKRWRGPFMIVDRSTDGLSYKLRDCETGKELRSHIHANRLKRFNDDRDVFFNKHNIMSKTTLDSPSSTINDDNTDADWCPIKKILKRKIEKRKEMFLVRWDDQQDSESWVPAEDVTDYAIQQYYKEKETERRKGRRRRQ